MLLRLASGIEPGLCNICQDPNLVVGLDGGAADLRLSCRCLFHYVCLVKTIRAMLGNRDALLARIPRQEGEAKDYDEQLTGLTCPNIALNTCVRAKGGRGELSMADLNTLVKYQADIRASEGGMRSLASEAKVDGVDPQEEFLTQGEVDKLRRWVKERGEVGGKRAGGGGADANVDLGFASPYILETSKLCPVRGCGFRETHFAGHDCHHGEQGIALIFNFKHFRTLIFTLSHSLSITQTRLLLRISS